jgi:hypothetical protein
VLHGGHARGVMDLPLIGQPLGQLADMQDRQVRQQLGEIELGIDIVAAAGTGQAGQDCGSSSASRVADEE